MCSISVADLREGAPTLPSLENKTKIYFPENFKLSLPKISELPFLPQVIKALSRPKEISPLPPPGGGADGGKSAQNQNMKAIRMLLTLMFLFCVCTAAPLVFNIYIMWGPGYFESVNIVGKCACVCVCVCIA